ncbi:MAG TPA: sigma 54-interacting transcriptional regulator [Bryobacteraceae bacterium]|nr:sigma 54-interacting transcriptional regulator [Bryobacteraceae bacterium]
MTPRLVAVAGPLTGAVFPVADADFSIGREESNSLCLEDRAVSHHHCVVRAEGERFKITDLGSVNRTCVNGIPVSERFLAHGDEIKVGHSLFLFLLEEEPRARAEPVQLDEGALASGATVELRSDDALYLSPEKVLEALSEKGRVARDLGVLLGIGTAISSVRGLENLERRLMELTFEAIPADHGAILLIETSLGELESAFHWSRVSRARQGFPISRTVASRVFEQGVAILCNDVRSAPGLSTAESVLRAHASSILAAPLACFEKVLGILYLVSCDPAVRFDENHLHLATGIAGIAAGALDSALRMEELNDENRRLKAEIGVEHGLVGDSQRLRQVYEFIAKAAPGASTVLIRGESGTGKELVARAIHRNSPRAAKPFVAINCAALTESLLESELFGHEKGAFTGAIIQKRGKLEEAHGGTVFLDEVGELAHVLQAKLLRVLQEREFERVGGTRPIKTDIRLIAATNRDLEEAVKAGQFRQDLYFRLNVVSVTMPPLRDRRGDIPLLASFFLQKHGKSARRRIAGISDEALSLLMSYQWPGNVRELENAIERAVVLGSTEIIQPDDLPDRVLEADRPAGASSLQYHEAMKEAKRQLILRTLEQAGGSFTEAAKVLGLHPNNLHRLVRTLNLRAALKK